MNYLFLIIALILNTSANILMKLGALRLNLSVGLSFYDYFKLFFNFYFILGAGFFVLNIVFYFLALSKINLSVAYPIMTSSAFILISLYSVFFLKESFSMFQWVGVILILLGIVFISYNLK